MSQETTKRFLEQGTGTVPLAVVAERGGLKVLEAMLAGDLPAPPMAAVLDFTLLEVAEGRVLFQGTPGESYLNPLGAIHGGWTASVMDSALGCAVMSTLKPGEGYTTVEFKLNLTRPLFPGMGDVTCEGRIVHRGRTLATSEAYLRDADGKLLAHGTETCAIFPIGNLDRR